MSNLTEIKVCHCGGKIEFGYHHTFDGKLTVCMVCQEVEGDYTRGWEDDDGNIVEVEPKLKAKPQTIVQYRNAVPLVTTEAFAGILEAITSNAARAETSLKATSLVEAFMEAEKKVSKLEAPTRKAMAKRRANV